jgi:hypothetical protein
MTPDVSGGSQREGANERRRECHYDLHQRPTELTRWRAGDGWREGKRARNGAVPTASGWRGPRPARLRAGASLETRSWIRSEPARVTNRRIGFQIRHPEPSRSQAGAVSRLVLWRWGRVELPVQGLRADRVYERSRRFLVSRNEARTDALPVLARSVYLSPPTDRSAGRSSAYIALPGPRSGDREDVSLTRQRERKKCWQLSACRSD